MKTYYFLGIKGSGMSALALVMHKMGYHVIGSDVSKYVFTEDKLIENGIEILEFDPDNLKEEYLVVKGNAFNNEHPEVSRAIEMNLEMYGYIEVLADLERRYTSVGITGTHGKTTTTSMVAHIFSLFKNASYLIGDGTGEGRNNSEYFVYEACEYRRHFLSYFPDYSIITNIDFDHPDCYKDLEDTIDAFIQFTKQTKKVVVACGDDKNVWELPKENLITYGFDKVNDYQIIDYRLTQTGCEFIITTDGEIVSTFTAPIFGLHNILNLTSAIIVSILNGISIDDIKSCLPSLPSNRRRFEETHIGGNLVIDDYAHHQEEIKAVISMVRQKYPDSDIVAVMEPYTFSRFNAFANEFAESVRGVYKTYICPVDSSAREKRADDAFDSDVILSKIPNSEFLTLDTISNLNKYQNKIILFMGVAAGKYADAYKNQFIKELAR